MGISIGRGDDVNTGMERWGDSGNDCDSEV